MATQVTINGTTYFIPVQGQNPPWGEELHDLLQALVTIANNTFSVGDISTTNFTIANNNTSASDVTSLSFDPAVIRSATITYSIYRSTSINELSEHGHILVTYKNTANTWELARFAVGDAGVTFSILPTGQIQYVSSNLAGTSYTALLKFSAKAIQQT